MVSVGENGESKVVPSEQGLDCETGTGRTCSIHRVMGMLKTGVRQAGHNKHVILEMVDMHSNSVTNCERVNSAKGYVLLKCPVYFKNQK